MAEEQQWEFCVLALDRIEKREGQWYYDADLQFIGQPRISLARIESKAPKIWSYNPWMYVFSFLGTAGWELVSVQHGMTMSDTGVGGFSTNGRINFANAYAYFKRPVQAGRRIDEPKLVLP